jgi:hypothetical protein
MVSAAGSLGEAWAGGGDSAGGRRVPEPELVECRRREAGVLEALERPRELELAEVRRRPERSEAELVKAREVVEIRETCVRSWSCSILWYPGQIGKRGLYRRSSTIEALRASSSAEPPRRGLRRKQRVRGCAASR